MKIYFCAETFKSPRWVEVPAVSPEEAAHTYARTRGTHTEYRSVAVKTTRKNWYVQLRYDVALQEYGLIKAEAL